MYIHIIYQFVCLTIIISISVFIAYAETEMNDMHTWPDYLANACLVYATRPVRLLLAILSVSVPSCLCHGLRLHFAMAFTFTIYLYLLSPLSPSPFAP